MSGSMASQALYLQREVTPGTAVTNAMRRVLGIKGVPGWEVDGTNFVPSGVKVNTARVVNTETATFTAETLQDYNALLWTLTGGFGAPAAPVQVLEAENPVPAYRHVFSLNPFAPDSVVTFTGIWGDAQQAVTLRHLFFNSLGITVNRGGLSFDTSIRAMVPETGASIPAGGSITTIGTVPVASRSWSIYIDDTWATLGTTKMLAMYEGQLSFGDKYDMDYVVDAAKPSFNSIVEAESTDRTGSLKVGFDAAAVGLVGDYKDGQLKFIRFESEGPTIPGTTTTRFTVELDVCVVIENPGTFENAPNSASRTLPFNMSIALDPVSNKAAEALVINSVASL